MGKIYKVVSGLKALTGFSYPVVDAGKQGKAKNRSVTVTIPGKYRPNEKARPVTFVSEDEYENLIKNGHAGKKSPFKMLMEIGESGGENGIIVKEVPFSEIPEESQKKFDPKKFTKLQAARKKLLEKELDKNKDEDDK